VLELRPNCECCNKDLPPHAPDAMICSFECTFCRDCVETRLGGRCPNCGGGLEPRPIRPANKLVRFPASSMRVFKPGAATDRLPRLSACKACTRPVA
jgi:uncharacterized protein